MGKLAFLFAGQGAQQPGMGKSLYDAGGAAKQVFELAEAARPGTLEDCFTAAPERLAQTDVTQPCVFAVDLAAAAALEEKGIQPDGVAGFSLGEMAALSFAGAFTQQSGFLLVCCRGRLMQGAAEARPGAMAAVLKLGDDEVKGLCAAFPKVYPVNFNCPGQVVVAGSKEDLPAFYDAVKRAGGLARPLAVGGAFHSPFMSNAAALFEQEILRSGMQQPKMPVYANFTAAPYEAPLEKTLASQMERPVRWSDTIRRMAEDGYDTFVEVGPGKTLVGFVKRIAQEARLFNVQSADDVLDVAKALQ